MLKTRFQSDKTVTIALAAWVAVVLLSVVVVSILIPAVLPNTSPKSLSSPKPFIDTQKINKVYTILVPN